MDGDWSMWVLLLTHSQEVEPGQCPALPVWGLTWKAVKSVSGSSFLFLLLNHQDRRNFPLPRPCHHAVSASELVRRARTETSEAVGRNKRFLL